VPDQPQLRAVLAEDQALLRVGLTRILEASGIAVVAAVDNAPQLERVLQAEGDLGADIGFDIAIVDVRLPPTFSTEGLVAAVAARAARPGLPVLVLSQHVEAIYARDLLASGEGAVGYLLKDRVADVDEFVAAVVRVAGGGTVLDPEVVAALVSGAGGRPLDRLTDREREVLTLMAEGRSNAAVAARLHVSEKAVGKHTNAIFTKLDLPQAADDNRRVLAVLAWLQGQ
jgi:DNA-binding NarL/FixJ family response regulator